MRVIAQGGSTRKLKGFGTPAARMAAIVQGCTGVVKRKDVPERPLQECVSIYEPIVI